jgi:hypothetical protein
MSLIERCWVEISDDDEQIVGGLTLDDPADFMVTDGFKLVEYVRADAYRGAVEALREHQRAFDEIDSAMHELDDAEALDAIVGIVNRTRGQ